MASTPEFVQPRRQPAAAQALGLKTAYIPRPDEHGPGGWMAPRYGLAFELNAHSLGEMAAQMAAQISTAHALGAN